MLSGQLTHQIGDAIVRRVGMFLAGFTFAAAGYAHAQVPTQSPGRLEVTIIPGGAMFFTSSNNSPSFGNYLVGGAAVYNFNRIIGVEGEIGGSIGISDQSLQNTSLVTCPPTLPLVGAFRCNPSGTAPSMLSYSANLIVNAASGRSIVPYATGGFGGLTVFSRESLGITSTDAFLTLNFGGGVKWYAPNGRWGARGEYRLIATGSNDSASEFFGRDNRYANRVYGAVTINALR
jgi:Outer membrane protein beta-barrel domain